MASLELLLGPVLFQGFELPSTIAWGGAQRLAIHRMPGGSRVIDAMGRDDNDITWAGIFTGPDAATRARGLDLMRSSGNLWPLTWGSFFYSVVIAKFEAQQVRSNWIPYQISCCVLQDESAAQIQLPIAAATSVLQDRASATAIAPSAVPANLDAQLLSPTNIATAPALAAAAAQQSAAAGYLARAARNSALI